MIRCEIAFTFINGTIITQYDVTVVPTLPHVVPEFHRGGFRRWQPPPGVSPDSDVSRIARVHLESEQRVLLSTNDNDCELGHKHILSHHVMLAGRAHIVKTQVHVTESEQSLDISPFHPFPHA